MMRKQLQGSMDGEAMNTDDGVDTTCRSCDGQEDSETTKTGRGVRL